MPKHPWVVLLTLVLPHSASAFVPSHVPVRIQSALDGGCIAVLNASTDDGGRLATAPCGDLDHKVWLLAYLGQGHYRAVARHSGKCLDSSHESPGSAVHQWTCHSGTNQFWRFRPLPTSGYELRVGSTKDCLTLQENGLIHLPCTGDASQVWKVEKLPGLSQRP